MITLDKDIAVIALSGGQDSATCLAWAAEHFDKLYTVSFFYGQRHKIELECSEELSKYANAIEHKVIDISQLFSQITKSALMNNVDDISSEHMKDKSLPASFVPFRNMFFLTSVAAIAYQKNAQNIITGICQTDFSGYPDCRNVFKNSLNTTLDLAVDSNFIIHSPLMWKTKAETVQMMYGLGQYHWYQNTHTCYNGMRPACGTCPACVLRIKGFEEAGMIDPLEYKI